MTTATAPTPVGVSQEHVTKTPGVCGGKACIADTRVRVLDVVVRDRDGMSPSEIAAVWDHITLADVHAALAYALDHAEDVAAEFRREQELADKYRPTGPTEHTRARDGATGG